MEEGLDTSTTHNICCTWTRTYIHFGQELPDTLSNILIYFHFRQELPDTFNNKKRSTNILILLQLGQELPDAILIKTFNYNMNSISNWTRTYSHSPKIKYRLIIKFY